MIVIVVQLWVISSIPSSTPSLFPTSLTKVGESRTDTAIKASIDRCGALFFWVFLKSIYMCTHPKEEDDDLYKFDPDKEPWWNRWERPTLPMGRFLFLSLLRLYIIHISLSLYARIHTSCRFPQGRRQQGFRSPVLIRLSQRNVFLRRWQNRMLRRSRFPGTHSNS